MIHLPPHLIVSLLLILPQRESYSSSGFAIAPVSPTHPPNSTPSPPISPQVSQELSIQPALPPQTELRKSTRTKHPPSWLHDFVTPKSSTSQTCSYPMSSHIIYSFLSSSYQYALSIYSSILEPSSFQQASQDPAWINTM